MTEAHQVYYLDGARNQQGPVALAEIERLIRSGAIRRDTLVWYAGMPDWRPAGQVNDLASLFTQAAPPPRPPGAPSPPPFTGAGASPRAAAIGGAYPGPGPQAPAGQYGSGERMGFGGAIATCFRKYVDFTGRARRPEFWFFFLFYMIVIIGLIAIDVIVFGPENGILPLTWLAALAMFLPILAVAVRRLHDQDHSGWMVLIYLIPLIGPIVVLVLMCLQGTPGANRFGPEPGAASVAETFS
jgi:uncharacterized membrane protein YhaH (DUF805 family)